MKIKYAAATILAANRTAAEPIDCLEAFTKVKESMGYTDQCSCVLLHYAREGDVFHLDNISQLDGTMSRDKGDGRLSVLSHNDTAFTICVDDVMVIYNRQTDQFILAGVCKPNYVFEDITDITVF